MTNDNPVTITPLTNVHISNWLLGTNKGTIVAPKVSLEISNKYEEIFFICISDNAVIYNIISY